MRTTWCNRNVDTCESVGNSGTLHVFALIHKKIPRISRTDIRKLFFAKVVMQGHPEVSNN